MSRKPTSYTCLGFAHGSAPGVPQNDASNKPRNADNDIAANKKHHCNVPQTQRHPALGKSHHNLRTYSNAIVTLSLLLCRPVMTHVLTPTSSTLTHFDNGLRTIMAIPCFTPRPNPSLLPLLFNMATRTSHSHPHADLPNTQMGRRVPEWMRING